MKIGRKVLKVVLVIIIILAGIILISYINHRIQLNNEESLFKPLGQTVEVDGGKMSVYSEGKGDKTLVFLSGGGTCSPILDFKSLYSQLSSDYRIVVIEKLGYGFSDVVDKERNVDNILEESRDALKKMNIQGPYILCPHSMSGIQSLYWAQKYPQEVEAIVGLDMAVPDAYLDYKINGALLNVTSFAAKIGITRLIPGAAESDAIKYGTLSDDEKKVYKAVFYRRTADKTMLNEVKSIKDDAMKVKNGTAVNIPMLMFCSNGNGTGWSSEEWKKYQHDYMKKNDKAKMVDLKCSHYVHYHEYKKIAEDMKEFIKEIK